MKKIQWKAQEVVGSAVVNMTAEQYFSLTFMECGLPPAKRIRNAVAAQSWTGPRREDFARPWWTFTVGHNGKVFQVAWDLNVRVEDDRVGP